MTRLTRFRPEEARPDPGEVLAAQGLPGEDALPSRLRGLLDEALRLFDDLAEPRALTAGVSSEAFGGVLDGLSLPKDETVVGQVYPRAERLRLFVATLGDPVGARVGQLFDRHDLAGAWMLDAVASSGADRLADLLARRFEADLVEEGLADARVLPYSPGYCGWSVRGQARLLAALAPERIGVTLNDACLMSPLKSVSGVLLAGPREIHRFRPDFPFCDECRSRECGSRMAAVLRR